MISPTTVIVLAAGLGRRFAGGSVLAATLRNAIASGLPVAVVTTSDLAPLAQQQLPARDVIVVPALGVGRGIGDSIAAGVSARADASGWLLLPADMPRVSATAMTLVANALSTHAVAYAQYRGLRGHPVGFSAELYSELVALSGDEGARRLVARYPAQAVELDDAGVLVDIDPVQDLAALRAVKGGTAASESSPTRG